MWPIFRWQPIPGKLHCRHQRSDADACAAEDQHVTDSLYVQLLRFHRRGHRWTCTQRSAT